MTDKPDNLAPVLYIPHGGGPLPLLGDAGHETMVVFLQDIAVRLRKPSAIIVVSAHWECDQPTLTSGAHPGLIYDYKGFPEKSYQIKYECAGSPGLAKIVNDELIEAGIDAVLDPARGYDHGMFVPLKIMYPEADIPCVQLSLLNSMDPAEHIRLGQAIGAVRDKNVMILGSGMSYHNMSEFSNPTEQAETENRDFDSWLIDTCTSGLYESEERQQMLVDWESAPGARHCHPREEHLLPLHVCLGAASSQGRGAEVVFNDNVLGKKSTALLWR
jgi:aromatic ring-opening dioxygenase catalytic subunit (LigB family)